MKPLRLVIAEDRDDDAELVAMALRKAGWTLDLRRVETEPDFVAAVETHRPELVISDFSMPDFGAPQALAALRRSSRPWTPFLIVSGSIGEEAAVAILHLGAADFVIKTNLARLAPAVDRALEAARVQRERDEALSALREAVRARDEFLTIAAHELRTPVTALRLQTQALLKRGAQVQIIAPQLEIIQRSSNRLVALVDRLLDVTRVEGAELALEREPLDLAALVDQVMKGVIAPLDPRCQLQLSCAGDTRVDGDAARLETMITTLLENACRYGAGRPVEVAVRGDGAQVELTVRDRGIGIAAADHERVFLRFERAVPHSNYGGLGLGLWLARPIARAHGGDIELISERGEGALFRVTLPALAR